MCLGVCLLYWIMCCFGLIEVGLIYYEYCQCIVCEFEEVESVVSQLQFGLCGWLCFIVFYLIGIIWIVLLLGQFYVQYLEICLDMYMGNEKLDLIVGEVDLVLCVGVLFDFNLVVCKLGSLCMQVFVSLVYIECYGELLYLEELQFYCILVMCKLYYIGNLLCFIWQLGENGGELCDFLVILLMIVNDMFVLNGVLVCGEGLLLIGDVMVKLFVELGMVCCVLVGWIGLEVDFNVVFVGGCLVLLKVCVFVDFLVEKFNFDVNYMLVQCLGVKLVQQQKVQEDVVLESSGKWILEKVVVLVV